MRLITTLGALFALITMISCSEESVDTRTKNLNAKVASGFNVDGDGSETEVEKLRREMRAADSLLSNKINQVEADSLARDNKLGQDILSLSSRVDLLEIDILKDIKALKAKDKELEAAITNQSLAFNDSMAAFRNSVNIDINALREVNQNVFDQLLELSKADSKFASTLQGLRDDFESEKIKAAADREKISKDLANLGTELRAKLLDQENKLSAQLIAFDDRLKAMGVATSDQINGLKTELTASLTDLDVRLSRAIVAQDAKLAEDLRAAKADLQGKITAIDSELANMNGQIEGINTSLVGYQAQLTSLSASLAEQLAAKDLELRNAIAAGNRALQDSITAEKLLLNGRIDQLNSKILEVADSSSNALAQQRIDLEKKLEVTRNELTDAIALSEEKLQRELSDLAAALAKPDSTIRSALAAMSASLLDKIALSPSQVGNISDSQIYGIRQRIETAIANLSSLIIAMQSQVGKADARMAEKLVEAERRINLRTDQEIALSAVMLEGKISDVANDLANFKATANATFATKSQLLVLDSAVNALRDLTQTIQRDINANDAKVRELIAAVDAKADKFINDFGRRVSDVEASVSGLRNEFTKHLVDYQNEIKRVSKEAHDNLINITAMITAVDASRIADKNHFESELDKVRGLVTAVELTAQQGRGALEKKIMDIEKKLDPNDPNSDLAKALTATRAELIAAIQAEQTEREKLAADVTRLTTSVEVIKATANEAMRVATANENSIKEINETLKTQQAAIDSITQGMKDQYNELKGYAEKIVADLDDKTQAKFTGLAVSLAELSNRTNAERDDLGRVMKNLALGAETASVASVENFSISEYNRSAKPHIDDLVIAANELAAVMEVIQNEILFITDSVNGVTFDSSRIIEDFRTQVAIRTECGGQSGADKSGGVFQPEVGGQPWFYHFVRDGYQRSLFQGPRLGVVEFDRVFFQTAPQVTGRSLASAVFQALFPSHASIVSGECIVATQAWSNRILSEQGITDARLKADLKSMRDKMVANERLRRAVIDIAPAIFQKLLLAGNALEALSISRLREVIGQRPAELMMTVGNDKMTSGRAIIAAMVEKIAENVVSGDAQRHEFSTIINVAKEFAKVSDQVSKQEQKLNALEADVKRLEERLDQISAKVDNLTKGLSESFGLIFAMASRLGFKDIADAAVVITADLGLPKWDSRLEFPTQCLASSRFYNYKASTGLLAECSSALNWRVGGTFMEDPNACRARRHVEQQTAITSTTAISYTLTTNRVIYDRRYNGSLAAYTGSQVRNTTTTTNYSYQYYWSIQNNITKDQIIGAKIGDLTIPVLAANNARARELLDRLVGVRPPDNQTMIGLRLYGYGQFIRLTDPTNPNKSITLLAKDFVAPSRKFIQEADRGLIYHIPVSFFLAQGDGSLGLTNEVKAEFLDHARVPMGSACISRAASVNYTYLPTVYRSVVQVNINHIMGGLLYRPSPIVLDLDGDGIVKTIDPFYSNATFDIDADMIPDRVGWIKPSEGFLAIDTNGNGQIDDGSELFGNYSKKSDGQAGTWDHGYLALAQYDVNGDGLIDAKDPVFERLLVWRDLNGDGRSAPNELFKLSQVDITAIGVVASEVSPEKRQQSVRDDSPGNTLAYESRFYGPKQCGEKGCLSYDILFGRDSHLWISTAGK